LKGLFHRLTEAIELLLRVVGQDQVPDKGQQAVRAGALLSAAYGARGQFVFQAGSLVRMTEEAVIEQQTQDQASA